MCRAGLTDDEIAEEIGISTRQLYRWYKDYPELCQSKSKGKMFADMKVENALYQRALGYDVDEAEVIATKDGRPVKVRKTKRHIAPNVTACIFWLKNRQGKRWRDNGEEIHTVDNMLADVLNQAWGERDSEKNK